jgi:predicted Rossmann fold nucleotide-binding protein DprA/Smf involved in DNA uptake
MFKMMELFVGYSFQTTVPAKKEDSVEEKTAGISEPAANVQEQVSEKPVTFSDLQTEPVSKDLNPSITAIASPQKTIKTEGKIKTPKKIGSQQKSSSSNKKPSTAIDEVQEFISRQKQGASPEDVMKATGFDKKKVQHILYKLKKRGILKLEKGIYIPMRT